MKTIQQQLPHPSWPKIVAMVVSTEAVETQMMEVAENLHRNELAALDRGLFGVGYRETLRGKARQNRTEEWTLEKQSHDATVLFAPGRTFS
ncbi:hypothetical protein [Rhizobium sp. FKL33]|uniref:hypothetical protein n=1 Tax=Rhizobium sp. FKL33 TaxID=2562307 RepID=UPI0010C134DC|nr:hypothetical protein [Rhizobium sp. FKL33]